MSILIANFVELEGSIQKLYDRFDKQQTKYLPMFFNEEMTDRNVDEHLGVGSIGEMEAWAGQVAYEDFDKGYKTTYRQGKFSKGIPVEEALILFKNFSEIKKRVNRLAISSAKTFNIKSAYYFNNAWNAAVNGGNGEGLSLANASHRICPGDSAGAQSNTFALEMNVDNIETMRNAGKKFKDDKGHIMNINLDTIVCGIDWEKTAKQICGSDKEPYVADNQINIYKSELKYIINPYVDGKTWGMVNQQLMKGGDGLNWKWARKPGSPEYVQDFDTEVGKYKITGWWSHGWDTWYWVAMSTGIE